MDIITYLQTLLIIFLISIFLYIFFFNPKHSNHGFQVYPLVGALPGFLRHRHRFLNWSTAVLSTCPTTTAVFHRPGKIHGVITANPKVVEHMLKTHFDNYPKGPRFIALLTDFLGTGIFNTDGELWKMQRKIASYEFSTKSLRMFVMENVAFELKQRLVPILEKSAQNDAALDFQDVLERFAFDNICKVAFNFDPCCLGGDESVGKEFMQAFDEASNLSSGRFMYAFPGLYKIKKFFNMGSEKKLRESIATVHQFADKIIRTRMEDTKNDEDLLSRFIGSGNSDNNDNGNNNSAEFLRDIVISFILAGRDTTSSALSWLFWILSNNRDVEEKILQELKKIRVENGKRIGEIYSFDELREMHYLQASIMEAMRLYPPVPVDTKICKEDDILPDGTFIGKDWFITYHTYAMGRMESVWGKDCFEYKPERWVDENGLCKQENPFKYPVFHGGVRMCLGKDMAYIQMKSIVACVLERFRFDLVKEREKCPEYLLSLTLRMKDGLHVRVKERSL